MPRDARISNLKEKMAAYSRERVGLVAPKRGAHEDFSFRQARASSLCRLLDAARRPPRRLGDLVRVGPLTCRQLVADLAPRLDCAGNRRIFHVRVARRGGIDVTHLGGGERAVAVVCGPRLDQRGQRAAWPPM